MPLKDTVLYGDMRMTTLRILSDADLAEYERAFGLKAAWPEIPPERLYLYQPSAAENPQLFDDYRTAIQRLILTVREQRTALRLWEAKAATEAAIRSAEGDDETERLIADEEDLREDWYSRRYRGR